MEYLTIIQLANQLILLFLAFVWWDMYRMKTKQCSRVHKLCTTLNDQNLELRKQNADLVLELAVVKKIYEGCRDAERDTGVKVDFDGNIQITRVAETSQEATAQIDEINRIINERIKKEVNETTARTGEL